MKRNKEIKILIFIASSLKGGAENLVVSLANKLTKLNLDVTVMAYKNSEWAINLSPQVTIKKITTSESSFNPLKYYQIINIINQVKPDIVNTHGAKASSIINSIGKIKPIIQVASKHNVRKGKIFNKLSRVVSVSKTVAENINHSSKIIYNGNLEQKRKQPAKREIDNFRILAIGRLDSVKGFSELIKKFSKLDDIFTLEIAGEGPQRKELELLIRNEKLTNRVKLLGHRSDVTELMKNSWCVVVSSKNEGFSLVITEALNYANMLLSTNVGISQEILPEELIFNVQNFESKIAKLKEEYSKYQNIFEETAYRESEKFTTERMASEYKNYFTDIINNNTSDIGGK